MPELALPNLSYEEGSIAAWVSTGPGTISITREADGSAPDGDFVLSTAVSGAIDPVDGSGVRTSSIDVDPSTEYTIRRAWKAPVGVDVLFRVSERNSGDSEIERSEELVVGTGDWETVELVHTTSASGEFLRLQARMYVPTTLLLDQPANTPAVLSRWAGGATDDAASVVYRLDTGASARLAVDTDPALGSPVYSDPVAPDERGVVRLEASGLAADTAYHYGIEVDGVLLEAGRGELSTMATGVESFSFAFGSCRNTGEDSEVFDAIRASGARFFLQTGDFHYGDIASDDVPAYRAAFTADILAQPRIQELMAAMPVDYTWGDHDYADNDAIGTDPGGAAAQQVYRELVPHYPLDDTDGIWHTFTCGRARFVVLDVQSYRTDPASDGSVLGAAQKTWLDGVIAAATEPVIFLVSHNTWNDPPPGTSGNGWGYFTDEVAELIGVLDERCYWLCGDAHMVGADDGTNAPGGFPVAQGAALDNTGSHKGGTFSQGTNEGGTGTAGQYGFITITDNGDTVTVDYEGRDATDTPLVTMQTAFAAGVEAPPEGGPTGGRLVDTQGREILAVHRP